MYQLLNQGAESDQQLPLPLYIKDNGNAEVAIADQIQLLDSAAGTPYSTGLTIQTDTLKTKKGHFLVPITVPAGSDSDALTVKSVKLSWTALPGASPLAADGDILWTRSAGDITNDTSFAFYPEAGEGDYTVTLEFFHSDDGSGDPIYEISEDTLTVWGNVDSTILASSGATNKNWYGTVTFTAGTTFRISGSADTTVPSGGYTQNGYVLYRSDIAQFHRTRFYVSNGAGTALKKANGTETGSIFAPFDTVAEAVAAIEADATLRETLWYIVVDGLPADAGAVTVTNNALGGGETGDYRLVIQSYKPNTPTTLTKGFNFYNKNDDSSDSALRVVLRNITVNATVNIGTEDLILDNAFINVDGTAKTTLMAADTGVNQQGIMNIVKTDATSSVKNITSTITNPSQVTVLRSYTINYDTPTLESALKNPYTNSGTADKTTYLAAEDYNTRFLLDDEYKDVTINSVLKSDARVLARNTTNYDPFEGCLTIKCPQDVAITFEKGLFATDVLSASGLTYETVTGYGSGWVIKPTTYSSADVTEAKAGAKAELTLTISVESLSPTTAPANDTTNVLTALKNSIKAYIKSGSDTTAVFENVNAGGTATKAQYVTLPASFKADPAATTSASVLEFGITIEGDLIDPDLDAFSGELIFEYELNDLKYSSPYKIIIVKSDS